MIPRYTLTRSTIPKLRTGGESIVYEALPPHPQTHSLIEVVERCCALGFTQLMKRPPAAQGEVWESVIWVVSFPEDFNHVSNYAGLAWARK